MAQLISKVLSVVVATVYLVAAARGGGGEAVLVVAACLVLPMACIWFSEEMGAYTGMVRLHVVTSESPGCLVAAGGWLLLLLPLLIGMIALLHELTR